MSNYTKTAIINPASSSPGATVQMSWVEKLRMQQRVDDVCFSLLCPPHTHYDVSFSQSQCYRFPGHAVSLGLLAMIYS